MVGQPASGAASGRYTATWVVLAHAGTDEKEETDTVTLRSKVGDHYDSMRMNFKCYRPPGHELKSVVASAIPGSSVTNFGMTLTVAHDAACRTPDKPAVFDTIVKNLNKLDGMVDVHYTTGGQILTNPPEDQTIFMHPMRTDDKDIAFPHRLIREARGDMIPFPNLGLFLVQVYDTTSGKPVPASVLGSSLPYVLGRHCDSITKITKKTLSSDPKPGIPLTPDKDKFGSETHLFDTLKTYKLPEYFLDPVRSETPSAKKYVSDFEIFRGKNSREITKIMRNYEIARSNIGEGHTAEEYSSIVTQYMNGVKRKRITLFNLQKVCALLSPPGTKMCELFIIGCRDPYPKAPQQFSVNSNVLVLGDGAAAELDYTASAATFTGDLNTPEATPTPTAPTPTGTTPTGTMQQFVSPFSQFVPQSHSKSPSPRSRRASKSPGNKAKARKVASSSRSPLRSGGGKKHKTMHGKRNKSLNVQNKSRSISRRTRRRVIKRKNNKK